ncbi:MAG: iron-responsive transcriptional regulator [Firmicutes bacterium ADurb.Bin506]|jgi:Rrf2 family nitric oxide-sensitive transcriptional repressor|nr:MAG: iron-responsive transcriptional regulator [Firmicutes bacterium ADurb.Bin506]
MDPIESGVRSVVTAIQMSEATSLALHSMAFVAMAGGELVTVKQIADATGFSHAHLSKVLQRLVRAGLLDSVRGPKGGFRLPRPASQITLLQVYEAMEGRLVANACMAGVPTGKCAFASCILGDLPKRLTEDFRSFLESRDLSYYICPRGDKPQGV